MISKLYIIPFSLILPKKTEIIAIIKDNINIIIYKKNEIAIGFKRG